jgi:hypothetical protein
MTVGVIVRNLCVNVCLGVAAAPLKALHEQLAGASGNYGL